MLPSPQHSQSNMRRPGSPLALLKSRKGKTRACYHIVLHLEAVNERLHQSGDEHGSYDLVESCGTSHSSHTTDWVLTSHSGAQSSSVILGQHLWMDGGC